MIRLDALWLCTQPLDMRVGAERLMAHVVHALGSARAHHGYLFANARSTRLKLLVLDGFGMWCAARRLNSGRFVWPRDAASTEPLALTQAQFDVLVVGLPWQRLHELSVIGDYGVAAGGHRLRALGLLAKAGDIPLDKDILCRLITRDAAIAANVAENIGRTGMSVAKPSRPLPR